MARILVADNDAESVQFFAFQLQSAGHVVTTAYSGAQTVDLATTEQPDVVLVAARLPGADALEIVQRLKSERRTLMMQVLVLLEPGDDNRRICEFIDAGARDCISRDIEIPLLLARIRAAVLDHARFESLLEMSRRLDEARASAEHLSRVRAEYLAGMSHEIRTPLNAILGYADLLIDPDAPRADRVTWVGTIRKSGSHLMTVLNDILDFSKIEAGEMSVEILRVSPFGLLEEVRSLMRPRAEEKRLRFGVTIDGKIPETIETDPTRLRQILVNLVSNALKFTESGCVEVTARLTEPNESGERFLEFGVRDTGVGMTPEELRRLFHAYRQGDVSIARRFGGTGLGLTISQRLAELLGGEIRVESERGVGSTFTLRVATGSLDAVRLVETESVSAPREQRAASQTTHSMTGVVLVAEDVPANQQLIRFHLERAGLTVVVADNGLIAVETCRNYARAGEPFELVLMDMQMPKMDGYTAAATIRGEGYDGPIVALTAHALHGEREKCLRAGCDDFATKPIDRDTLIETVARNLRVRPVGAAAADSVLEVGSGPLRSELVDTLGARDPGLVRMVADFVRQLPSWVDRLESAMCANDFAAIAEQSHQLKGAGGGFGFPLVSDVADRIESIATSTKNARELRRVICSLREVVARATLGDETVDVVEA